MLISKWRKKADRLLSEHTIARGQVRDEKLELERARNHLEHAVQAQQIVQGVAQAVQKEAHSRVAKIVTKCLHAIFDDPYDFRIIFEQKRGKTEARLVFIKDGHEVTPGKGSGGGPLDVASFALRLACLVLSRPAPRRLLVLDESFKMVSRNYSKRVGSMLTQLSKELDVQFVLVTHNEELQIGKVIEVS
jgi:DNA repair exonuclease SbcCD ATPase subunit